jgi:DNA-binding GntR family transcriptional regulator
MDAASEYNVTRVTIAEATARLQRREVVLYRRGAASDLLLNVLVNIA